jgi:hypothetical protein
MVTGRSWPALRPSGLVTPATLVLPPDLAVKAARVLDLHAGTWDGEPTGPNDFLI